MYIRYGHIDMTMKKVHVVPAGRFKAECLGLLDHVAETGATLVVTKRGRPVARLVPMERESQRPLLGSVEFLGDVITPLGEDWEAER